MQHETQHRLEPWTGERPRRTSADEFFAPPGHAKPGHAMTSLASKLGSVLMLLAISSVAAVGVFMPEEDKPLASSAKATNGAPPKVQKIHLAPSGKRLVPKTVGVLKTVSAPRHAPQQAYALAYELARQRVRTVSGLTPQQRIETARDALARVLGGNVSRLDPAATAALAQGAPDTVKNAAFRGARNGEAMGISDQSQLLVERMLSRERRPGRPSR